MVLLGPSQTFTSFSDGRGVTGIVVLALLTVGLMYRFPRICVFPNRTETLDLLFRDRSYSARVLKRER